MGTCFNTKMLQPCDIIIEKKQSTFLDRLFGRAIAAVDKISQFDQEVQDKLPIHSL